MGKRIDITGQRFGMLVVRRRMGAMGDAIGWLCLCECGGEVTETTARLTSGRRRSCGCLKHAAKKHGQARSGKARTGAYHTWASMMGRCYRPSAGGYRFYGARGIQVCERWHSFQNFASDMGDRPYGATLDRIDPNCNYEQSNCRWASRLEQSRNTRRNVVIEFQGKSRCASEWAALLDVSVTTIYSRINAGLPTERVLCASSRPSPQRKPQAC